MFKSLYVKRAVWRTGSSQDPAFVDLVVNSLHGQLVTSFWKRVARDKSTPGIAFVDANDHKLRIIELQ